MFLRKETRLDYVHRELDTGLMQAGPKARTLERGAHRVIYFGRNLWSHLVQMPCSKSGPFAKFGQAAQGEIPEVAQHRVISE